LPEQVLGILAAGTVGEPAGDLIQINRLVRGCGKMATQRRRGAGAITGAKTCRALAVFNS
jgi:hypothetical protein